MSALTSRRTIAILLALCASISVMVSPARADVTISAAPSLLEVSATPGGTGSQEITVTNAGSESFSVSAEIAQYKGAEGDLSATAWLKVEPASFALAPRERRTVRVSIAIPRDAISGGRYAMVAFRTGGVARDGSMVGVAAQVGVPFLITVKGAAPLAQQAHLETIVPVLESNGSLGFRATVENSGNTHFYARGAVDVVDERGNPWGRLTLRDTTAVLPGSTELVYSDRPIAFTEGASYTARAAVSFGDGTPEVKKEAVFDAVAALEIDEVVPSATAEGGLEVRLQLKNSGGLGVLPRVMMAVRGEDGRVAGVLSPNEQPLVLPGQTLEMEARYPGRLAPGKYDLVARAEYASSSVQEEAPFEIAAPAAGSRASVPVSKWAEGSPKQAVKEPGEVAGVSPAPVAVAPVPESAGSAQDYLKVVLPLLGIALAGVLLAFRRRGSGSAVESRFRNPLFLPAGGFMGSIFAGRVQRRERHVPDDVLAALLPPPPLYLLPSPVDGTATMEHSGNGTADPARQDGETGRTGWLLEWSAGAGAHLATDRRAMPNGVTSRVTRTDGRPRTRLASVVAEKAATLVREAAIAAQRGDQVSVEWLSRQALQMDARNVDAWLWLAASCGSAQSARLCLEAVQLLDPNNAKAKRALAALDGEIGKDGTPNGRWMDARRRERRRSEGVASQQGS